MQTFHSPVTPTAGLPIPNTFKPLTFKPLNPKAQPPATPDLGESRRSNIGGHRMQTFHSPVTPTAGLPIPNTFKPLTFKPLNPKAQPPATPDLGESRRSNIGGHRMQTFHSPVTPTAGLPIPNTFKPLTFKPLNPEGPAPGSTRARPIPANRTLVVIGCRLRPHR